MSKRQASDKGEEAKPGDSQGQKELTKGKVEEGATARQEVDFEVDDVVPKLPNGNVPHANAPELTVAQGR